MRRFLVVSVLCAALFGLAAPVQASEADGPITIEWEGESLSCIDYTEARVDDVLASPYYYLIHYPPYGIFWIAAGAEESVECLLAPVNEQGF